MFISFFTGKVMLFYGISLIMKEKSNASALLAAAVRATRGRWQHYSRPRIDDFFGLLGNFSYLRASNHLAYPYMDSIN